MDDIRNAWKARIARALEKTFADSGIEGGVDPSLVIAESPPKPEMGDIGFPMFSFARLARKGPPQIARSVAAVLAAETEEGAARGSFSALGPYVNVWLDRPSVSASVLARLGDETVPVGRPGNLEGSRIMVEFSSPNTNKPLHLGHLRNDILGESIARIRAACGAEVRKV
jgi:arginyl-tRNA synthetase